jgi:hypothetical protein
MSELSDLVDNYLDSIRLYLWYQGSPFSFHQGKADKAWADKYKKFIHYYADEIKKKAGKQ